MTNSARLRCVLTVPMERIHSFQIIAGFTLLEEAGLLDLSVEYRPETRSKFPSTFLVQAEVEGRKIAYDTHDAGGFEHPENTESYLSEVDFYFKRGYDPALYDTGSFCDKVYPLGFNYLIISRHPFFFKRMLAQPARTLRSTLLHFLGYDNAHYFGLGGPYFDRYEDVPRPVRSTPKVLFLTRTYRPRHFVQEQEREELNETRAICIRLLRREFGDAFTGGFKPTKEAVMLYPDCVVKRSAIAKNRYLERVKEADICVTTKGVADSNGWKLGEYIAASKGIVSESLRHVVPGDFAPGRNFLVFDTPERCVSETVRLATTPDLLEQMRWANYDYYQRFLRPDRLILNTLNVALDCELTTDFYETRLG